MSVTTAKAAGLVGCRACGRVNPPLATRCARCDAVIESRDTLSLQKVWAWWLVGLIAYIPANLYPMLITTQAFSSSQSSIVGGVGELWAHGDHFVAFIVFVASVAIPVGKFVVIGMLAWILRKPHGQDTHMLLRFHEVVEFIGRWSMIDVFVVALLVSLVQFGALATIVPGVAALCFAASVVFTMLSAQSFDSRLIWDRTIETDDD